MKDSKSSSCDFDQDDARLNGKSQPNRMADICPDSEGILALLRECLELGQEDLWNEFIRKVHKPIAISVMRAIRKCSLPNPDLADDLVQRVFEKLCDNDFAALRRFRGDSSEALLSYLRTVATNATLDDFEMRRAARRDKGVTVSLPEEGIAGASVDGRRWTAAERNVFLHQIEKVLDRRGSGPNRDRDRRIFWLHHRQGLTARAISQIPEVGLSPKGVESTLLRLMRELRGSIGEGNQG